MLTSLSGAMFRAAGILLILVCSSPSLQAIPQFTLLSGNRCINCHVNFQGSGLRNELGWYAYEGVSLVDLEALGMAEFFEALTPESNALLDGSLTLGADFRLQMTRAHDDPDAERKIFPMQGAFYAAYSPMAELVFEGTYSAGPQVYDGQENWAASVQYQPNYSLPQLRAGYFQPSIGMRYDDHTMMVRSLASTEFTPLIAPNYAELGAELTYFGLKELSVSAGLFQAKNLAEQTVQNLNGETISLIEDENNLSTVVRAVLWPRLLDGELNTWLGASLLANGDFTLSNYFVGVGWTDRLALMAEYARSDKDGLRTTDNFSLELMYQLRQSLLLYARAEDSRSDRDITEVDGAAAVIRQERRQYVFGAQVFLLPWIELRPEYRIVDTDLTPRTAPQYRSSRWHAQLHFYF